MLNTICNNFQAHLVSGQPSLGCYFTLTGEKFPINFAMFIGETQLPTQRVVRITTNLLSGPNYYLLVQDLANLVQQTYDTNNQVVPVSGLLELIARFRAAYI